MSKVNSYREYHRTGQCKKCKDVFTVVLCDRRGEIWPEQHRMIRAEKADGRWVLTHNPLVCGGRIAILWSDDWGPLTQPWESSDPLRGTR